MGNVPKDEPLQFAKLSTAETDEQAMARAVLSPAVNHALTAAKVLKRDHGERRLTELCKELAAQCDAVSDGNMARPEALLTAQAHTLDAIFNDLTRLAYRNWDNFPAAERLLRLAFKAQSQSRATVETLGNLRNPPMVIARQANIAHGPQQVNNGEASRTREIQSEPSKLLEQLMANGWTPERRARQSAAIRQWRPWERSTGPRTAAGKARVARNAYKGGSRGALRLLSCLLREMA
jgi:hypothetical protein